MIQSSDHPLNLCLHGPFLSWLSSLLLFPHAESLLHVTGPEQGFTLQYFQSSFDQDLFDIPWNWSKLEYVDGFCSPTKDFQRELCQQPWEESQPRTSQSSSPHRQCWGREENGQLCLQLVCIVKIQLCHNDFKHCESESSSSHLQRLVWSQFVGFCSDETYI